MRKTLKKTSKSTKSEASIKGDIRSRIRLLFVWYGEEYKNTLNRCRVSRGFSNCEGCGRITKKIEVDHYPPVIRTNEKTKDISLDLYYLRVFCKDGETKTRGLCPNCHSVVTSHQNFQRKEKAQKNEN